MKALARIAALLDIRAGELRNTLGAFATLLAVTTGHTMLETARDAFFLAKMPPSRLPWMYLIIVAFALGLAQIRAARADSKRGVALSLVVGALITTAFWTTMRGGTASHWILYALYIWTGLFGSWAMVQIWTLLGRAHTMTQAKRLYGFIGGGAVLGGVVGALLARVTISMLSPRSAVLMASGFFVLSVIPCLLIKLPIDDAVRRPRRGTPIAPPRRPLGANLGLLWENGFVRRVLYIVLVATITVTVGDYLFKSETSRHFTNTRELGNWLSGFYAVTNTIALVAQLVIAPWLFRRVGVHRGLLVFPATMLAAGVGIVLTGGAFAAAMVLKGLDGGLRYSIHKTSTELLLVPVPDGTRERIKPIVDLVGSRGGQALASVAILGLVAASGAAASAPLLGAIVIGLSALWLVLAVRIRSHYLDVFRETLKSGGLSGKVELAALDLGALETLFTGLNSNRDSEVIASLELLAEQHRERLIPALILYHPSREVVLRALEIFTEMGRTDFVSIADRLNQHADGEVAAAALRARTAVHPVKELLLERLGDVSPHVRATALIALMARGWIEPEDANRRLDETLAEKSWQTAAELARAVAAMTTPRGPNAVTEERFDDLLVQLDRLAPTFHDAAETREELVSSEDRMKQELAFMSGPVDIRIRLEVARAMAVRASPKFFPVLLAMLSRHELRGAARGALVEIPGALDAIDRALSEDALPRDISVHLPRTASLFEPTAAAAVLMRHLETVRHGGVRYKVMRGLVRLRRADPALVLDQEVLARVADVTLRHVEELRRWGVALSSADKDAALSLRAGASPLQAAHHLLVDFVHDKELHATQRLFLLLELIHGDPFDDIWRGLQSKNDNARASSLELLENLVQEPLRGRVLSLVGDPPPIVMEAALGALSSPPTVPPLSYEDAIREILQHQSHAIRTLAEYRAVELGIEVAEATGERPSYSDNPLAVGIRSRLTAKVDARLTPRAGGSHAPA